MDHGSLKSLLEAPSPEAFQRALGPSTTPRLTGTLDPSWHDGARSGLRALTLRDVTLSSPDWAKALEHARLDALEELHVVTCHPMGDEHVEALCRNPSLGRLRTLSLQGQRHATLGDRHADGISALYSAAFRDTLTRFEIGGYDLHTRSFEALFTLPRLAHLDLRGPVIVSGGVLDELARAAPTLRTLRLPDTPLDARASSLFGSSVLDSVEELRVVLDPEHEDMWSARGPLKNLGRLTAEVITGSGQRVMANATRLLEHILPADGPLTHLELQWRDIARDEHTDLGPLLDLVARRPSVTTLALPASNWSAYTYVELMTHPVWSRLEAFILTNHTEWQRDVFTHVALRHDARPRVVFQDHALMSPGAADRLTAAGFECSTRPSHHDRAFHASRKP